MEEVGRGDGEVPTATVPPATGRRSGARWWRRIGGQGRASRRRGGLLVGGEVGDGGSGGESAGGEAGAGRFGDFAPKSAG